VNRVVLLGKGSLAIRVAEWIHDSSTYSLAAVVPVVPEPSWTASLIEWCRSNDVRYVSTGHFVDVDEIIGDERIGLALSIFYNRIIGPEFIDRCDRILNLHNAPLPRYRGKSPINWALKNGEDHHGVTLHEITPGIDDGPIVAQVTYSIYPDFDEVIDVYERSLAYAWTLVEQILPPPVLNRIEPRPQDESRATYYSGDQDELLGERRDFTREQSRARRGGRRERHVGP
jgi:methionyl-tRNA formyltransferase